MPAMPSPPSTNHPTRARTPAPRCEEPGVGRRPPPKKNRQGLAAQPLGMGCEWDQTSGTPIPTLPSITWKFSTRLLGAAGSGGGARLLLDRERARARDADRDRGRLRNSFCVGVRATVGEPGRRDACDWERVTRKSSRCEDGVWERKRRASNPGAPTADRAAL